MKYAVARFFLVVSLLPAVAFAQTKSQRVKRENSPARPLRICQGVPIPDGYVIVAYETSSSCPHGAYVLKKEKTQSRFVAAPESSAPKSAAPNTTASRPRKVNDVLVDPKEPELVGDNNSDNITLPHKPILRSAPSAVFLDPSTNALSSTGVEKTKDEEVSEGDVVRIDTNLVTVPLSVLDRQGRFVSNLRREQFTVLENGVEQKIAHFEPTEKPFTVALLLDTSASTFFHLSEIKEAAIAFAKQLRPQDRVLVVTFDREVMLLTEATSDLDVVTEVIEQNANTGFSTRLYDAVDLVIKERLNKIEGRKAIVLFTDGVDTASYTASYQSTLREVDERDVLIYPIQYDTSDYMAAMGRPSNITIVTSNSSNWPFPSRSSSRVIYSAPTVQGGGSTKADYRLADHYLHQLADKTGGRLYQANDRTQLADAFSKIAEELRYQYSLGYYPQTALESGERRLIKVRVDQPNLAVRARDSYVQRGAPKR
jgi:Ca-activated chloride channel homolog